MSDAFAIKFDPSDLLDSLDGITHAAEENARPAAQAGIQVLYEEVLLRVPLSRDRHYFFGTSYSKYGTYYGIGGSNQRGPIAPYKPGNLRDSIYQAYSKDNSGKGRATYHSSWNYRKAPYGHMVENGTPRSPAYAFLRPAHDAAAARALKVAEAYFAFSMQPALKGQA